MKRPRPFRHWWLAPLGVAFIGTALSSLAFVAAERAEDRRVLSELQSRAEWRALDLAAKVRLAGNAVESVALAVAAEAPLDPDRFDRLALRARQGLDHVNALQWAPRVPREQVAAFESAARALGISDYRLFDVTPDFQPTALADRAEYFPVLYDRRFNGNRRRVLGLALGRYEGRRLPMMKARDEGRPVATSPVRPIGPPTGELVYLLFWPVYDGVGIPATVEERRVKLRGFAVGNYDLAALLSAAIRDTPEPIETIHVAVAEEHQAEAIQNAAMIYSPAT